MVITYNAILTPAARRRRRLTSLWGWGIIYKQRGQPGAFRRWVSEKNTLYNVSRRRGKGLCAGVGKKAGDPVMIGKGVLIMFFRKKEALSSSVEYIVVGLGNSGTKYENTRHNAGFITVDALADKLGVRIDRIKYKSLVTTCTIGDKKVLLMKPSTYMNNSGLAVVEAMNFYKVKPENVIVIFDDISLDVGKMRIRRKGSDGGHNGIKNIIYLSGSDQFPRIKMGVGHKPEKWQLADWVLSRFSEDEYKTLSKTAENACTAVELMISGETDKAMNLFNS